MGFRRDWQDMRNMLNWRSFYAVKTKQMFLLRFSMLIMSIFVVPTTRSFTFYM